MQIEAAANVWLDWIVLQVQMTFNTCIAHSIYGDPFALIIMHWATLLANQTDAFSRERGKKPKIKIMLMIINMKIIMIITHIWIHCSEWGRGNNNHHHYHHRQGNSSFGILPLIDGFNNFFLPCSVSHLKFWPNRTHFVVFVDFFDSGIN